MPMLSVVEPTPIGITGRLAKIQDLCEEMSRTASRLCSGIRGPEMNTKVGEQKKSADFILEHIEAIMSVCQQTFETLNKIEEVL